MTEVFSRPELVFALVGAAGTRLDKLSRQLEKTLKDQFDYDSVPVRLSGLLREFDSNAGKVRASEFERITELQTIGNTFRARLQDGAALVRAGIAKIRELRAAKTGSPDIPVSSRAYILTQLKHPAEVDLLREVYGSSFFLLAGHTIRTHRKQELANQFARCQNQRVDNSHEVDALNVIDADEKQADDFGQNTRDTYPKADFFANLTLDGGERPVERFVELLFGHPFLTPSPDEYAMYQARAASLRSSDDNRQVGSAIAKVEFGSREQNADVIAVGMNEVARAGGGAYWQDDSYDARDQALLKYKGQDRANEIKTSALKELIDRMRDCGILDKSVSTTTSDTAQKLLPSLKGTQFMDIGEFSRPVHAEMAALLDAARRGVAVDGKTMYVTTFPCHNCAKHIIASGITQVVYLEPYPKSRTRELFDEDVNLEAINRNQSLGVGVDRKVAFFGYNGVAPRQYQQLFSLSERVSKKGKKLNEWEANKRTLSPVYVSEFAYLASISAERRALEKLPTDVYKWDPSAICPE